MSSSQKRAIQNYRARLTERGLSRFEVPDRDADRNLLRLLARRPGLAVRLVAIIDGRPA